MESKKRNKLGTTLLCSLPPLSALVVTGVVIASTKPSEPVVTFGVTEPEDAEGRKANSVVTSDSWTPVANEKIKYTFDFSGVFTLAEGFSVDNLSATCDLIYEPAAGQSTTYPMTVAVNKLTDTTFTLSMSQEYTYGVETSICDIVGNTSLAVKNLKIKESTSGNEYTCAQSYEAILTPSLVLGGDKIINVSISSYEARIVENDNFIPYVNGLDNMPTYKEGDHPLSITFEKSDEWALKQYGAPGWFKSGENKITFYADFATVPSVAGSETKVGFECRKNDTTYFKKTMDTTPSIIFKIV